MEDQEDPNIISALCWISAGHAKIVQEEAKPNPKDIENYQKLEKKMAGGKKMQGKSIAEQTKIIEENL
jgi:hypothetical protein